MSRYIRNSRGDELDVAELIQFVKCSPLSKELVMSILEEYADNTECQAASDNKSNINFKDIKKLIESEGDDKDNSWIWIMALVVFFFGFSGSNGNADYWRGKYDALKEHIGSAGDKI